MQLSALAMLGKSALICDAEQQLLSDQLSDADVRIRP